MRTFIEIQLLTSRVRDAPERTERGAVIVRQPLAANSSSAPSTHGRSGLTSTRPGRTGTSVVPMCVGSGSRNPIRWTRKPGPRCRWSQSAPNWLLTKSGCQKMSRPKRTNEAASNAGSISVSSGAALKSNGASPSRARSS